MFSGFEPADFDLFTIEGFQERMEALKTQLRPKFYVLGDLVKDELSAIVGDEMYPHVAKHARRTTNPPNDSWVAFGGKRGYKMAPHFQICVWSTHVLIQWGLIYESRNKTLFAHHLITHLQAVRREIPEDYQWSKDHMKPEGTLQRDMTLADFENFSKRLLNNKNGEVMVGKMIPKSEAVVMSPDVFVETTLDSFRRLAFLHRLAVMDTNPITQ